MNYTILKAGDVRQEGDECRQAAIGEDIITHQGRSLTTFHKTGKKLGPTAWKPTALLGHPILLSDLLHLEFRRPQ